MKYFERFNFFVIFVIKLSHQNISKLGLVSKNITIGNEVGSPLNFLEIDPSDDRSRNRVYVCNSLSV